MTADIDSSSNPALVAEVAKAASAPLVMSRQATSQLVDGIEVVKETPKEKVEVLNEAEQKHDQSTDQGDETANSGETIVRPGEESETSGSTEDRGEKIDTLA